ncbi:ABC transporter ATP-binding protein [Lysinibacillus sp. 54212]|uniref:ABC transporter ATP-binding protein n=1 Tax=Lysinibacillus sp. 54212 TaxID=3119829 RepID=UPI002FCC5B0D
MNEMLTVQIERGGYAENETIISNICFQVQPGELVGLIGANGAGKSTTLQAIMGTLPIMDGEIHSASYGYVPERPILYEYFTLWEHIDFLIRTIDGDEEQLTERAMDLCRTFRLESKLYEYPTSFSKGMQQEVMLILAFLPDRRLYILDEPFMGLDPQAIRRLLTMIDEYKTRGAAILMSTHALDTAERICDAFVLVDSGRILHKGTLSSFREKLHDHSATLLDIFDRFLEDGEHGAI